MFNQMVSHLTQQIDNLTSHMEGTKWPIGDNYLYQNCICCNIHRYESLLDTAGNSNMYWCQNCMELVCKLYTTLSKLQKDVTDVDDIYKYLRRKLLSKEVKQLKANAVVKNEMT
jgi:hypothetical protein